MINKTYLHPIRTPEYSNSESSCHALTSHSPSNKISPYSKLKLPLLSPETFFAPPHSPKNLESHFNWRQKMGERVHVQIRVPHSLLVKLSAEAPRASDH